MDESEQMGGEKYGENRFGASAGRGRAESVGEGEGGGGDDDPRAARYAGSMARRQPESVSANGAVVGAGLAGLRPRAAAAGDGGGIGSQTGRGGQSGDDEDADQGRAGGEDGSGRVGGEGVCIGTGYSRCDVVTTVGGWTAAVTVTVMAGMYRVGEEVGRRSWLAGGSKMGVAWSGVVPVGAGRHETSRRFLCL